MSEPRPPSPDDKLPSGWEDLALTLGLLTVGAVGGGLYFKLVLGAKHHLTLVAGGTLFPVALIAGVVAWRAIVVPFALVRLARESINRRSLSESMDATPKLIPGRGVFLVVPPLVCVTGGFVLGLVTELPLMGTTLHMAAVGFLWGIWLFILSEQGYLRIGLFEPQ